MSDVWTGEVDWVEIEARFSPPPELLGKVPRRAVARSGEGSGCRARIEQGCLSGCLLPFFALGMLLVLWAGLAVLILPFGATTTGVVTERQRGTGRDSTYFLQFRFRAKDGTYKGTWQMRTEQWKRTRVGDEVRVRYFPFAPGLRPILEEGLSPWASIFGLGPLGLLMMGIGVVPFLGLRTRRKGQQLVRHGIVTPAFIIERDDKAGTITFLLRDENGGVFKVCSSANGIGRHSASQIDTALYLPGQSEEARLYDGLDWKIEASSHQQ